MSYLRTLGEQDWGSSEFTAAYDKATRRIVYATGMSREEGSTYDERGYMGDKSLICLDCLAKGRETPVILVHGRSNYFRHPGKLAPGTLARHGEAAGLLVGKRLLSGLAESSGWVGDEITDGSGWAQDAVATTTFRMRSTDGSRTLCFEIHTGPLSMDEWHARRSAHREAGETDIWLWAPVKELPVVESPTNSIVFSAERRTLGILVAKDGHGGYVHPSLLHRRPRPTHCVEAPVAEWRVSDSGELVPPEPLRRAMELDIQPDKRKRVELLTDEERHEAYMAFKEAHTRWRTETESGRAEQLAVEDRIDNLLANWTKERKKDEAYSKARWAAAQSAEERRTLVA